MKRVQFIFVFISMLFAQLHGFANIKFDTYSMRNTIKIHDSRQHAAQRNPSPAQVFQIDRLLTAESLDFESDFKIIITNMSTGEIVFEQTYNASIKYATIDLNTEKAGDYKIELSSANRLLYGDFSL